MNSTWTGCRWEKELFPTTLCREDFEILWVFAISLWQKMQSDGYFDKCILFIAVNTVLLFMIVFAISVYWDINFFIIWFWLAIAILKYLYLKKI